MNKKIEKMLFPKRRDRWRYRFLVWGMRFRMRFFAVVPVCRVLGHRPGSGCTHAVDGDGWAWFCARCCHVVAGNMPDICPCCEEENFYFKEEK